MPTVAVHTVHNFSEIIFQNSKKKLVFVTMLFCFQWTFIRSWCHDCGPWGSLPSFWSALGNILDQRIVRSKYFYNYCLNKAKTFQSNNQSWFYSFPNSSLSLQANISLLLNTLASSSTALNSPEVILILLTCPLLQEEACISHVIRIALVISDLKEKCLTALSKQSSFFFTYKTTIWNYVLNEANQNSEFPTGSIHPSSAHMSSSSNSIKTPDFWTFPKINH